MLPRFKLATSLLLLAASACAQDGAVKIQTTKDIVFAEPGGVKLKLDLASPAKGDGPFPVVVCIHGGSWRGGNKVNMHGWMNLLAEHGYAAASVDYRLAPEFKFPAQVDDVKAAVCHLRAHAKELKLDPDRFAALGESAGGHLALLLGVLDPKDGLDAKDKPASKVQAVVNFFGPSDFTAEMKWTAPKIAIAGDFLGSTDPKSENARRASPTTYIDAADAPVITFQGTKDAVVPAEQAQLLHGALKKAGVKEKLVLMEGQGHGWTGEKKEETGRQTLEFLDEQLKNKNSADASK